MKTRVKICGLTRLEDARYCAAAGVDFLGFVLAPASPRRVDPDHVKELVAWVYGPRTVGVFVDENVEVVNRVARDVGFDLVQLHGSESPDECRAIEAPVIKAISVGADTTISALRNEIDRFRDSVSHLLLDTSIGGSSGGTGVTFDWSVADGVVDSESSFVAGGIGPHNVHDVIARLKPFAVDVSSGVEDSPGVKSFEKVSALLDAVRGAPN